jgi:hypothetical protein
MTDQGDQATTRATAVADFLFRITTSPLRPGSFWPAGRIPFLDQWIAGGGKLRSAGPKWFAVWDTDIPRMQRLNCVVLPASWLGLAEDEMIALLFAQLRKIDPTTPETPMLSNALARARSRLRLESMRGD